MSASLKVRIQDEVKAAMRAREGVRLAALRLVTAAIKQREVDERIELDDAAVLAVLDKMLKQRRDSLAQYEAAARADLAEREAYEIALIESFMPARLDEAAITAEVETAIAETGAASLRDMGRVMGLLKPKLQGRADLGAVSGEVRKRLSS